MLMANISGSQESNYSLCDILRNWTSR